MHFISGEARKTRLSLWLLLHTKNSCRACRCLPNYSLVISYGKQSFIGSFHMKSECWKKAKLWPHKRHWSSAVLVWHDWWAHWGLPGLQAHTQGLFNTEVNTSQILTYTCTQEDLFISFCTVILKTPNGVCILRVIFFNFFFWGGEVILSQQAIGRSFKPISENRPQWVNIQ